MQSRSLSARGTVCGWSDVESAQHTTQSCSGDKRDLLSIKPVYQDVTYPFSIDILLRRPGLGALEKKKKQKRVVMRVS